MDKEIMSTQQAQEYIESLNDKIMNGIHVAVCPNCMARMMIVPKDIKKTTVEIPLKLPSLNEYIKAINSNRYKGNQLKQSVQDDIMWFIKKIPRFEKPIHLHFHWIEGNRRRDYDNVASAKKFILDALVKAGKLKDDNRNYVAGFRDTFGYEKDVWKVILEIEEQDE